jgi:hypothetical protein
MSFAMIVLNLLCSAGHKFEGWFASVSSFDEQLARRLVACPHCNGRGVERLPTAPRLVRTRAGQPEADRAVDHGELATVMDMLRNLADASEDVGDRFPDEARRMHYREVPVRPIRGQATLGDTKELIEEGIHILPVPKRRH